MEQEKIKRMNEIADYALQSDGDFSMEEIGEWKKIMGIQKIKDN